MTGSTDADNALPNMPRQSHRWEDRVAPNFKPTMSTSWGTCMFSQHSAWRLLAEKKCTMHPKRETDSKVWWCLIKKDFRMTDRDWTDPRVPLSWAQCDWLILFHDPDWLNPWIVLVGVVSFIADLKQSVHFNIKHSKRPFSVLNIWVISVKLRVIKVCKSALIPASSWSYHSTLFENTDSTFLFLCQSPVCAALVNLALCVLSADILQAALLELLLSACGCCISASHFATHPVPASMQCPTKLSPARLKEVQFL